MSDALKTVTETPDGGSISLDQLIALNDEIAALVRAGVPLERGLLDVGDDLTGRLGALTTALGARMGRGEGLAEAMAAEGDRLPETYRAVVEAGVRSGRLASALEGLARFARGYAEMRRAIGLALLYPLIVLTVAYLLFVGFVIGVVPRFLATFASFRLPTRGTLVVLARLGETAPYWVPIVPALLLAVVVGWVRSGRAASLRSVGPGGIGGRLPGMRSMIDGARAACFADLLALLLEHRVPLHEGIALAMSAVGDASWRREGRELAAALRDGASMREGLRGAGAIPPLLRWLLATDPSRGDLAPALRHAAESYRLRAVERAEAARVFLPPLLMLAVGATATLVYALTLFVPLSALLESLSQGVREDGTRAMPTYRYNALDADGRRRDGELEADDPDRAAARLAALGLRVEDLRPVEPEGEGSSGGRLSRPEVAEFARHVAVLAGAGLPMGPGLRALAEELPSARMRPALRAVAERLEAGESLEAAVEAQGGRFPAHLRGLVLAGVRSGDLGHVLGQFVRSESVGSSLRRKVWMNLAYPLMLLVAAGSVFAFIGFAIVSRFEAIFGDFGIPLPVMTIVLIRASRLLTQTDWPMVLVAIAAVPLALLLERAVLSPPQRARVAAGLPLVGTLRRWIALAEFCDLLGLLVESALPLPEALPLAGEGSRDAELAVASRSMAVDVGSGMPLAEAVARRRPFPDGLAKVLRWAEGHQSLPEALRLAAAMFEARARAQAEFVGTVGAFLSVILVLWGIGFVVVALFLPLIQLISRLSG